MSFGFGFALPAYPLRGGTGNNPFNQSGPTLDLSFVDGATNVGDQLGTNTYTLNTNFITPEYQVAAQYAVWENGVGMTQKNFADIVTFTRASTATYFDSTGTLQSAAINEARFDYNPSTLAAQGLLIEEARTNSIRNNTMQGAVAGTPGTLPTNWQQAGLGTLTREIVGTGTENGITYVDIRYSGTTSTTSLALLPEQLTQITAASGQTWTSTFFLKLQAGSTSNITSLANQIRGYDSGGIIQESNSTAVTLTTSLTRFAYSYSLANAASTRVVNALLFSFASGAAIDITLRIGLPQLEQGAFATSAIPTTTTALTRSADVASVNTLSPWYNATEGSFFVQAISAPVTASPIQQPLISTDNGTTQNLQYLARTLISDRARLNSRASGSIDVDMSVATSIPASTSFKVAYGYRVNDYALVLNASTPLTDTSALVPEVTTLYLGQYRFNNDRWCGHIQRLTYYPRRLSNAELQTITT